MKCIIAWSCLLLLLFLLPGSYSESNIFNPVKCTSLKTASAVSSLPKTPFLCLISVTIFILSVKLWKYNLDESWGAYRIYWKISEKKVPLKWFKTVSNERAYWEALINCQKRRMHWKVVPRWSFGYSVFSAVPWTMKTNWQCHTWKN